MIKILLSAYLFFIAMFLGGIIVIVYHLLTFRLNKILAWVMVTLLLSGAVIFLGINLIYFFKIDWITFLADIILL